MEKESEYPLQLPPNPVPPEKMRMRYRLPPKDQEVDPFRGQFLAFKSWMGSPVQMDRDGRQLSSRTIENISISVLEFLGFMKLHKDQAPSLLEFLRMQSVGEFISFHVAKGNSFTTIQQQLCSIRKVISYLGRAADGRLADQIVRAEVYTSKLTKQLSWLLAKPKKDVAQLQEQGSWMAASDVVKLITAFRKETEDLLPGEGQPLSLYMARQLHDATLACCMFSYMPPIRLCVLRTLQVPQTTKCLHPDCKNQDCLGNKLHWKDGELYLYMSHFKVNNV